MKFVARIAALLLAAAATVQADEGMWTVDNFPKTAVKEKLGVDVTDAWLDQVRLSTTRLESGCTGSFVSKDGLILTNHHCVALGANSCLAQNSSADRDLVANGFVARTRDQELPCKTQQVSVLVGMEDITSTVNAATQGLSETKANEARKKELTKLEQACEDASKKDKKTGPLSCSADPLYNGGQYMMHKYKRYDDVRLVFAPEESIAAFGGDVDNFQYPRWCLDLSMLRVYENGKPASTPNFLRLNFNGPQPGDAVFVSGHPGGTERSLTLAELTTLRNSLLPFWLLRNSELRGRYIQFGKQDAESHRIIQSSLDSIENTIKVRRKELDALLDDRLMQRKTEEEKALRTAIAGDPELRQTVGSAFEEMDKAQARYRDMLVAHTFIEGAAGFNSDLYRKAFALVRATAEKQKPNEERLREYTNAALPRLEQSLKAKTPVYPALEKMTLSYSLERMREWLGPDTQLVRDVFGNESADSLAATLVDGSKLADPAERMRLYEGGPAAVQASSDPMIVLARKVDSQARALRKQYEDEVEAPTDLAAEKIARARFKSLGKSRYPDANFTLRINYGTVQGWTEKGQPVEPFTQLSRAFERTTGQEPFVMPASWQKAKSQLDLGTRFNLSTNNDITGGNSGSPLLNSRGELVGLMFDGNIHSISGSYWFDTEKNRAVAVHPAIIREALTKVYGAEAIVSELAGKSR